MIEQAGIYRVTLYENKGLSIIFIDNNTVRNVTTSGATIVIENSDCETMNIKLEFEHRRAASNKLKYLNTLSWILLGLTDDNIDLIAQLKESIYSWVPVIEFYNNDQKIITNPFLFDGSEIDNNVSNSFNIELKNAIFGNRILDYTPATTESFISTDVPGGNIEEDFIPIGTETIHLS